jgi:uncharacterized protein YjiK
LVCACPCLSAEPAATDRKSLELGKYVLKAGPLEIGGARKNASGVTYNPDTKTLFVVTNKPKQIFEIGLDGKHLRTIDLSGFSDTEGIAYLGEGTFAVAEEKRRCLCVFKIDADTKSVDHGKTARACVDPEPGGNSGTEGVAYDPAGRVFYAAKEKSPRKIYRLSRQSLEKGRPEVTNPWDAEKDDLKLKDISDLCWHAPTGNLLVLSHESACLVECTPEGKEVSRLSLAAGSAGLRKAVPQAEGITVDTEGTIYVCSEPRQIYIFTRKAP